MAASQTHRFWEDAPAPPTRPTPGARPTADPVRSSLVRCPDCGGRKVMPARKMREGFVAAAHFCGLCGGRGELRIAGEPTPENIEAAAKALRPR